jgi:UrcA family protein
VKSANYLTEEIIMNSSVKIANRMPLAFSAAMLLACVWAVSTAFAGEQGRSETVKFSDLDVNTSAGVQALYGRIHAAAWRVCTDSSADPIIQMGARRCARDAEAKAIGSLNLPQLTAFYRAKAGDHTQPLSANR